VEVRLTNVSGQRVGVLLKVAGRNTFGEQIDEGGRCRRWVLEPGKEQLVKGYYAGEGFATIRPFKVGSPASRGDLTCQQGDLIEMQVYLPAEQEERKKSASLRGLARAERAGSGDWAFEELHSRLIRRCGVRKVTPRAVGPDEAAMVAVQEELRHATFAEYRRLQFEPARR
jgi:hypothetical protein